MPSAHPYSEIIGIASTIFLPDYPSAAFNWIVAYDI